jgi:hypothetical protein
MQNDEQENNENDLSPRQRIYRNYLKTVTWKHIREEALKYYNYTCQNCGREGRDVHHVYYPEQLGAETIDYLKVLCRSCHDLEHTPVENNNPAPRMEKIHVRAISSFLSDKHTEELQKEFPDKDLHTLFLSDTEEGAIARKRAIRLLNIQEFFTHGGKKYSSAYGLYDFVVKKEMEDESGKIKQTRKKQEDDKKREAQRQADRQRQWKKTLEEHNPRLYRKLSN